MAFDKFFNWFQRVKNRRTKLSPVLNNDLYALAHFILHPTGSGTLASKTAEQNLYRGIIEIMNGGMHSSNGLLITENGYFITPNHCVEENTIKQLTIRMQDGSIFPLERLCAIERTTDIALVKAAIPAKTKPLEYRFCDNSFTYGKPIAHLSRWYGKCLRRYGLIEAFQKGETAYTETGEDISLEHRICLSLEVIAGDSGGIIVSPNHEIIGITESKYLNAKLATASKWNASLEVVRQYIDVKHQRSGLGAIPWKQYYR